MGYGEADPPQIGPLAAPAVIKRRLQEMIGLILEEYEEIIDRQDWMSLVTKERAVRKLRTMQVKIGYPDEWPAAGDMMQVTPVFCISV